MEGERLQLHKSLVNEITKGMEQVKQLKVSSSENALVERMLASYAEALLILTGRAPQGQCQSAISSSLDPPGSSVSVCKVTQSKRCKHSLKRKFRKVRVKMIKSGASVGEIPKDGFTWRKYGEKPILGSKFPRSYYKCAQRGCPARTHVQRSNTDPTKFEAAYTGEHTCQEGASASTGVIGETKEMP